MERSRRTGLRHQEGNPFRLEGSRWGSAGGSLRSRDLNRRLARR
jgi:hypothetical protein